MTNLKTIPEILKAYRKKKNITQKMLAIKLGIAQNTLSRWERGFCKPCKCGVSLLKKMGVLKGMYKD